MKDFVEEVGEMLMQINELLRHGLPSLEARVNHVIKYKEKDYNKIDRILSDLLDYTQIDEGLAIFKRLCRYSYTIHPELTVAYIGHYREMYDPDTPCNDEEDDE